MPTAQRRQGPWLAAAIAAVAAAATAGWWIGHLRAGSPPGPTARPGLEKQAAELQLRLGEGEADTAEQLRLLELLVALDRKAEAIPLLEQLADQNPERWPLRLLLAELRRDQNDRSGAERELRQLLNQRPNQVEGLQLMALIQLETGRGAQAQAQVSAAFKRMTTPTLRSEALPIGLLLANVLQRRGEGSKAEAELIRLSTRFPKDPRPLLARALLQQEKGDTQAAQKTLAQAKDLGGGPEAESRLDEVAAAWGLEKLRTMPLKAP